MNIELSDIISRTVPYAFDEVKKKADALKKKGVKVIDFGVGDPKSPPAESVMNELSLSVKRRSTEGYPSYVGDNNFREACARYMKKDFGVDLDHNREICSSIGSKEAIFHFPFAFLNEGDLVICPSPGYPPFRTGTEFARGSVYIVSLLEENNYLIDFESIPEDVAKKAKIIWTNYPNSPTGVSAPKEWLEKLIDWARKYNVIIAADEGCYIDIYFGEKPHSILELTKEGVVAFYSLSKRSSMTMFRVGFVAGDERIVSAFKKVKTNVDSGTPTFVQDAAILALEDEAYTERMRQGYMEKRNLIKEALESRGLETIKGDATFFLWQKAPKGMSGMAFADRLIDIGLVVTPGEILSEKDASGHNAGQEYVRLALVPTLEDVKEASRRIREELRI